MRAYFDTTVYDDIAKGEVGPVVVEDARSMIARGVIRPYLSIVNIEELTGQWETKPYEVIRRLRIVRDLVGFGTILKQPSDLLRDAIRSYAAGVSPPSPMLPREQRDIIVPHFQRITDGDAEAAGVLPGIVSDVREMKDNFKRQMERACNQVSDEIPAAKRRGVTFGDFYTDAILWAEALADAEGLGDKCRARGLDGLLEVRVVQFTVGAMKSLVYSQVVGEQWQPRHPHRGDGYDLWHAELASGQ